MYNFNSTYFIIGSSGGLGSYLVNKLNEFGVTTFGFDITPSSTTNFIVSSDDIQSYSDTVNSVLSKCHGSVVFIITVAATQRLKGGLPLKDYICESNLISTETQLLLVCASLLKVYAEHHSSIHNIINIGSVLAHKTSLYESPLYSASKASTLSTVRYLAIDLLQSKVKVNTISPCLMARNSSTADLLNSNLSKTKKPFSLSSYEDVFKTVYFISEFGVNSLNGTEIVLDDGLESLESYWSLSQA